MEALSETGSSSLPTSGWSSSLVNNINFCSIHRSTSSLQEELPSSTLTQSPMEFWVAFVCVSIALNRFGARARSRFLKGQKPPVLRSSSTDPRKHQSITPDEKEDIKDREEGRVMSGEQPDLQPAGADAVDPDGGRPHVLEPVKVVPWPKEPGGTRENSPTSPLQSARWGTSSDNALRHWTPFFPAGSQMFGRVRKQSQETRPIFCGPNCDVWKCDMQSSEPPTIHTSMVVVKVLRHHVPEERDPVKVLERMNARWNQEVITWAGLSHPNIVPLIGIISFPIYALILPWYKHGNLGDYLSLDPSANRLNLISDVAKGLESLHFRTPPIVHADIKPENILINDQGKALLTDFGMATVLNEDCWYTPSHRYGGTYQWMAPEVLLPEGQEGRRSRKGDVFSFGSLACYVMTDRKPHECRSQYQIIKAYDEGEDPIDQWHLHRRLQDHRGLVVAGIIRPCWSRSPNDRPLMSTIVNILSNLIGERESILNVDEAEVKGLH